ncbi:MAG: DUF3078 domain-containing protein [Chitinophagaceae bacterium]|nr:DUF3078 domain-containing protein [Chitinophagaceae bacterium]
MRKVFLAVLLMATIGAANAQDSTKQKTKKIKTKVKVAKPTVKGKWVTGGMFSLAAAQGGSRNWAPGGDRYSMATNAFLNLYANNKKGKCHWDNMLDVNYGLMYTEKYGAIKNDDKFDLTSKWTHEVGKLINKDSSKAFRYGITGNFRTQLTDGYDYDGETRKRISDFFAPGILVLSPGIDYTGIKDLNVHFSPTAGRWILVPNRPYELGANYGVVANREVKNEWGSYLSISYNHEILKNVYYRGRFDVFANYVDRTPGNMDLFFTNMFYLKVNKYLGVVYSFDMQYDDDTRIFGYNKNRPATQLKSIFGVGLSVKF